MTCPEAIYSLIRIEKLPKRIWEPACGTGNIVKALRDAGHDVHASDISRYKGVKDAIWSLDYLTAKWRGVGGCNFNCPAIVTNPPFKLALEFAQKAVVDSEYVALLGRISFLETPARKAFFEKFPCTRIWVSSRRLPMMHREGWKGKRSSSNVCYCWYVWDHRDGKAFERNPLRFFDWKDYYR